MKKKNHNNFSATGQYKAADIQQQLQQLGDMNDLNQRSFTVTFEKQAKSSDDSVELKKTTKGIVWNIKIYGNGHEALQRASDIHQKCTELYGDEDD